MSRIFAFLQNHYKTVSLALGVLSALSFAPYYFFLLLPVCFMAVWLLADIKASFKSAALIGYWFGFGMFSAGFCWVGNALLIDADTWGWLYPITLIGAGAFFGLFTILPFVVWCYLCHPVAKISGFAAAWVLLEWVRSFVFTGFPWNLLGTVWAFHPSFIQTASIWGTYGLSFWTIVVAGGFYLYFRGRRYSGFALSVGVMFALLVYGLQRVESYEDYLGDVTIRLVQPSIPQKMKWDRQVLEDNLNQYITLSRIPANEKIDFVIWGETAVPFDPALNPFYLKKISEAVPAGGYLITGALRFDGNMAYNSLYVINDNAEIVDFYDKNHLVPFGEYIPLRHYLPDWVRPIAANIADFGIGEKYKNISIKDFPVFGALICYEIIFPDEVINRDNKPDWLVLVSNDGWYGDSAGPYQHLAAAQMRAVEEGVTIIRSANSGISAAINPLGEIYASLPLNQKGVLDVKLVYKTVLPTFYNTYGKKPVVLAMLLILTLLLLQKRLLSRFFYKK